MGHPSASEFSQTQGSIKKAFNGSRIHREIPCHYSSTRERKRLQKALKSRAQRNQRFSKPFFVAAGKIAGFESPELIPESGQ
jgi:hypothetical protein